MLNELVHHRINQAIKNLSPDHQEILILVVAQSMSYNQVAEHLDISLEDVRDRLSEAREALQVMMNVPAPKKIRNFNPQSAGFYPFMAQAA